DRCRYTPLLLDGLSLSFEFIHSEDVGSGHPVGEVPVGGGDAAGETPTCLFFRGGLADMQQHKVPRLAGRDELRMLGTVNRSSMLLLARAADRLGEQEKHQKNCSAEMFHGRLLDTSCVGILEQWLKVVKGSRESFFSSA